MFVELAALLGLGWLGSLALQDALDRGVAPWIYHDADARVPFAASFSSTRIADGTTVASYYPATRAAMVRELELQAWTVRVPLGVAVFTILPGGSGASALGAMRAAALAGQNVYVDADLAMKLGGSKMAPKNNAYVAVSPTSRIAPAIDPADDDEVALTSRIAVESLRPGFPPNYVLFAKAGEVFG